MSGPGGAYSYTARGTLASVDDGTTTTTYTFDAFGRLTDYNGQVGYVYDALDRVTSRAGIGFAYSGVGADPVSDGTFTYALSPGGRLLGVSDGTDAWLAGANRHGDLTHLFTTTGTLADTSLFDPFGDVIGTSGGVDPTVGFQSDYTDPASGRVWMGARWYDTTSAAFLSRDSVFGELSTPVTLNRHTYAGANPLRYWDPDGRMFQPTIDGLCTVGSCGSGTVGGAGEATTGTGSSVADVSARTYQREQAARFDEKQLHNAAAEPIWASAAASETVALDSVKGRPSSRCSNNPSHAMLFPAGFCYSATLASGGPGELKNAGEAILRGAADMLPNLGELIAQAFTQERSLVGTMSVPTGRVTESPLDLPEFGCPDGYGFECALGDAAAGAGLVKLLGAIKGIAAGAKPTTGAVSSATNTGSLRIGDDVIAVADDAFTHGYKYDPRIRAEGLLDPAGHNFPYSFDDVILRTNPVTQADGSLLYRVPGSIGSKDGFFEIALNTDTGTIFHRSFRGG